MSKVLVSAHQGGNVGFGIEAFINSSNSACDYVEFDVQLTADGVFVISHDNFFQLDGVEYLFKDMSYSEIIELTSSIPTMRDVLKIISAGGKKAHVDLKFVGHELDVIDVIEEFLDRESYIITTCNDSSLKVIHDVYGDVCLGLSLGRNNAGLRTRLSDRLFASRRLKACGASIVVAEQTAAKKYLFMIAQSTNRRLLVWTPDEVSDLEYWLSGRCWMVTSNQYKRALSIRSRIMG